jgi:hypothetical protein
MWVAGLQSDNDDADHVGGYLLSYVLGQDGEHYNLINEGKGALANRLCYTLQAM